MRAALVAACLGTVAACGSGAKPTAAPQPALTAGPAASVPSQRPSVFTESGVSVSLLITAWNGTDGTIQATFTPEQKGYHLYSTALPADGIDGVGKPTAVRLTGALSATGPLATGTPVRQLTVPGVAKPLPVYPDGAVTVRLPVHATASGQATALVSYAACSETEGCLVPVADHPVALTVVDGKPAFTAAS